MPSKFLAATVAFIIAAWCATRAHAAPPLADRVPSDAVVYIGWSGSQSLPAGYDGSHLKAVLDQSGFPELFQTLLPQLMAKVGPKDRDAAEVMRLINAIGAPMWRHPAALYFGGVDWTNGPPTPRLAVLCDAGVEADGLLRELTRILARAGQGGPPITARKYGSLVVVAIGQPAEVDRKFGAAATDVLSKSGAFSGPLAQVPGGDTAVAAMFIDAQGLVKEVDAAVQRAGDPQATALWPKIRDGLGLGGFRQAIWTCGFDGRDWSDQAFVGTDGGKNGLLSLFNGAPLSDDALAIVPKTANSVVAGRFDLAALVREVRAAIDSIDPNVADQFDRHVSMVNGMLGIDVQKELLDPLGDQWVLYTDRTVGGPDLFGAVIVNKLRDPAKFDASLTTLADHANQMMADSLRKEELSVEFRQTTTSAGVTVHYLAVPFITPAWAVKDGNLFLAFYPQVIDSATSQIPAAAGESILQNPAFVAVQKRLGDHKPTGVSFTNLPETAPDGYSGLLAMSRLYLGFADMFGIQTPAMVLPPLHKLMPHVAPLGAVSWSDGDGWHFKSIEPFPGSQLLASGGAGTAVVGQSALMTSILLPSLNRARETANRVKCASNERQIGQAMLLYANENKQKYPDDLGTLIKTQDITVEVFLCPSGENAVPPEVMNGTVDQKATWVNDHADYVYLGKGQKTDSPADRIMLYEKPGAHGGDGMNILYGDGHVEFQRMDAATREIDKQEKRGEQGL